LFRDVTKVAAFDVYENVDLPGSEAIATDVSITDVSPEISASTSATVFITENREFQRIRRGFPDWQDCEVAKSHGGD
jgi:hypothetical protein